MKKYIGIGVVVILVVVVWVCSANTHPETTTVYMLEVGQGDSALIRLPSGEDILIDGGPPTLRALREVADVLGVFDRTIDMVVLSHAEADHFGGLLALLERYRVGTLVWNGFPGNGELFDEFMRIIETEGITQIIPEIGDKLCFNQSCLTVLSPHEASDSDLNDSSLVMRCDAPDISLLFAGDISENIERQIVTEPVDVLKVAHHGSRYASSDQFLKLLHPAAAIIGVGANSHGHPADETLERLARQNITVLRTDLHGRIMIRPSTDGLEIRTARSLAPGGVIQ